MCVCKREKMCVSVYRCMLSVYVKVWVYMLEYEYEHMCVREKEYKKRRQRWM